MNRYISSSTSTASSSTAITDFEAGLSNGMASSPSDRVRGSSGFEGAEWGDKKAAGSFPSTVSSSNIALSSASGGSASNSAQDRTEKEKEKGKPSKANIRENVWKYLFCFAGLQLSYLTWGVVQEQLMTKEYAAGKFSSSAFCVFMNRFLALFIALAIVTYRKSQSANTKPQEAPTVYYAPSSISNSISSWAQYEALKYVSFPTTTLSKSCKIIPVMLVGILVNKKVYSLHEYVEALIITFGVAMFTLSEKSGSSDSAGVDTTWGIFLVFLYLMCDSFTSQWQSKVFKRYGVDQYQMMLGVNVWSIAFTGVSLAFSGEGVSSLAFLLSDSKAFLHMLILSITSATGQLFIFYTIKEFGPVHFTIIMTSRQILSLVISCLTFGHTLHLMGWISTVIVFSVVLYRIYVGRFD